MHPHVSGTERVGFSKQDTRGNLVVASLQASFSPFRTLRKASTVNVRWTEHDSYLFLWKIGKIYSPWANAIFYMTLPLLQFVFSFQSPVAVC